MAGLLASALAGGVAGGGQAIQKNAENTLQERRQTALLNIRNKHEISAENRAAERGAASAAAEREREDKQRAQDRKWEIADAKRKQQHDLNIANVRASGRGGSTPSSIREAEMLVERGVHDDFESAYETVRSRAGQNNPAALARDELEYENSRLESINETLNDRAMLGRMSEEDVTALRERAEDIRKRIPELEMRAFNRNSAPAPIPSPNPNPVPDPSNDGNEDPAASILNKYF
jgi:hypothetical protein